MITNLLICSNVMGKFKRLLVYQMVAFCDLVKVSIGCSKLVDKMLAETRKTLFDGLIQSGFAGPALLAEILKENKDIPLSAIKAGFGAVRMDTADVAGVGGPYLFDGHDQDSIDVEEENQECIEAMADLLRHVTFRVKMIAEVVRRQEDGALHADYRTFISDAKATLATVRMTKDYFHENFLKAFQNKISM